MLALYLSVIDEKNNKDKFEELFDFYKKLLYYIAFQVTNNEQDAEDAVQEAFLRIAKNMDKIDEVKSTQTKNFVAIIVKREAMKIYNRKSQTEEVYDVDFSQIKDKGAEDVVSALKIAINALPNKYSSLMVLKYVMGYSGKEISKITGLSETNVRQQLFVARKMLEDVMKEVK